MIKYRDLQAGDVLCRDGRPLWVVIECSRKENVFKWIGLLGESLGKLTSPDLERSSMWDEELLGSYDEVLRGDSVLLM